MKILLVTRGSQGDVYPYLAIASELKKRGHKVTLNLPKIFEKFAQKYQLEYVLQAQDDIEGMINEAAETSQKTGFLLSWVRRAIDSQFEQLPALLDEHDILVSTNTEFASPSVAEYCEKPIIRTAFAPFIPGKNIPPPVIPFPKPHPIITPRVIWKMLNIGNNYMTKKTINKNRKKLGISPIKNAGYHAASFDNYLLFSRFLGSTDSEWQFPWNVGGYCFNDSFEYEQEAYEELMSFIQKDNKPVLFFTLGSCSSKLRDQFCEKLMNACKKLDYKLIVGSGWSKTGAHLQNDEYLYLMKNPIPHNLIFPACDAVLHHGGAGTTHSVARAGKPQIIIPLIADQHYWAYQVGLSKLGPSSIKIGKISEKLLQEKLHSLVTDSSFKQNAAEMGEKIRNENGIQNICDYIESFSKTEK